MWRPMNPFTLFAKKLNLLFSRNRFRSELDEEMAFHREQAEKDFIASGMSSQQAHAAAARQFGNATHLREQSHSLVAFRWETVAQDLRFALRQLRQNPGFAVTAVFILALGMGVSVAIFGFVDAALIQPLPYSAPSRLMDVAGKWHLLPALQYLARRLRRLEASQSFLQLSRRLYRRGLSAQYALWLRARQLARASATASSALLASSPCLDAIFCPVKTAPAAPRS